MYGDQPRSPGRDDRQDGASAQQAPWETGRGPAPAYDDVKVAGSPNQAGQSTGAYETGAYNTGAYNTGAYDTSAYGTAAYETSAYDPSAYDPSAYEAGAHETSAPRHGGEGAAYDPAGTLAYDPAGTPADGNATASYDPASYGMGAPYRDEPAYGTGEAAPYEPGAASGTPPIPDDATSPDIPVIRDTPPRGSNKRLIQLAAVAVAVAVVGGAGAAWAVSGNSSAKPTASGPPRAQMPAPAPLTDAQRKDAEDKRRKELKQRAARAARDEAVRPKLLARGTPPPSKTPTAAGSLGDPTPVGEAQQIARAMLPDFGWSPSSQFGCLVSLWNKESHWNTHAGNQSGAYGIPQALPGSKMASAGPDWQNNAHTQIKWGLGYIKGRYSTPCDAWAHSESTGWY